MSFPFEKREHKIYRNAFLQSVFLVMEYTQKPVDFFDDDYYKNLKKFITNNFVGAKYDEGEARKNNTLKIVNSHEGIVLILNNGRVLLIIDRNKYRSFVDSVVPWIYRVSIFLRDVVKVDSLNAIVEKKVNFWQVAHKSNEPQKQGAQKFSYVNLEKAVLSNNIINDNEHRQQNSIPDKNGQALKWLNTWEDNGRKVVMGVSLIHKDTTPHNGCLVLDTEYSCKNVRLDELQTRLMEANDTLFDAYHWAVNDTVIRIMNFDVREINGANRQHS